MFMARMITKEFTFDDMENEVRFSRASLKADPDAAMLHPRADSLLGWISAARDKDALARTAVQEASAFRFVANTRLDAACRSFGRDLAHSLSNDRSGARWHRFFRGTVDDFTSQPLADQAAACLAWLTIDEPVLARTARRLSAGPRRRRRRCDGLAVALARLPMSTVSGATTPMGSFPKGKPASSAFKRRSARRRPILSETSLVSLSGKKCLSAA